MLERSKHFFSELFIPFENDKLLFGAKNKTVMSAVRPNLCPQLSEDVVSKLRSAGVKTVVDLIKTDLEGLALETSLPYKVS